MTLTEFLLARLAEDEAAAKAATPGPWSAWSAAAHGGGEYISATATPGNYTFGIAPGLSGKRGWEIARVDSEHIARHDPARILADIKAKRRIVALHAITRTMQSVRGFDQPDYEEPEDSCEVCGWVETDSACETIRALAQPFRDHPDYQKGWEL